MLWWEAALLPVPRRPDRGAALIGYAVGDGQPWLGGFAIELDFSTTASELHIHTQCVMGAL